MSSLEAFGGAECPLDVRIEASIHVASDKGIGSSQVLLVEPVEYSRYAGLINPDRRLRTSVGLIRPRYGPASSIACSILICQSC